MSARPTRKPILASEAPIPGRADLPRLRRLTDAEIEHTAPPELAELPKKFWDAAEPVPAVLKELV